MKLRHIVWDVQAAAYQLWLRRLPNKGLLREALNQSTDGFMAGKEPWEWPYVVAELKRRLKERRCQEAADG